jgi:cytochrome P450
MGRFFLVNEPEVIGRILEGNYRNYPKSDYYHRVRSLFGAGLFELEGEVWRKKRQTVQRPFTRPNIERSVAVMVEEIDALFDRWEAHADTGVAFDICPSLMAVTLNVISRALCSSPIQEDLVELSGALATVMREGERILWSLWPALHRLPTPHHLEVKHALQVIDRMIYRMVRERIESGVARGDLLDTLLAQRDESGAPVSMEVIHDDLLTMLIAGHETTAIAIGWASASMSRSPHVLARLKAEASRVLGTQKPTAADLGALEYASWTFQEAIRFFPPFWTISRKPLADDMLTTAEGKRYAVPAGSTLMLCPYVTHRNARHWQNPEGFFPERFSPEEVARRHRWAYFPFGGGPRVCLGKHFALVEGQLFLAMLAQRFTLHLEPGARLSAEAMISLRPRGGIRMTLHSTHENPERRRAVG